MEQGKQGSALIKVGQNIVWQVRGKSHAGIVAEVVPAGIKPQRYVDPRGYEVYPRKIESYVIDEDGTMRWPFVSWLQLA